MTSDYMQRRMAMFEKHRLMKMARFKRPDPRPVRNPMPVPTGDAWDIAVQQTLWASKASPMDVMRSQGGRHMSAQVMSHGRTPLFYDYPFDDYGDVDDDDGRPNFVPFPPSMLRGTPFAPRGQQTFPVDLIRKLGDKADVVNLKWTNPVVVALLLAKFYTEREKVDHLFAFGAVADGLTPKPENMLWDDDCDESQHGLNYADYESEAPIIFINEDDQWRRITATGSEIINIDLLKGLGIPAYRLDDRIPEDIESHSVEMLLTPFWEMFGRRGGW